MNAGYTDLTSPGVKSDVDGLANRSTPNPQRRIAFLIEYDCLPRMYAEG
jgi:hypothetical protein